MNNEFAAIFKEEAQELLENLEQDLLDLEDDPDNSEIVDRVFRTMHTIKGSGAMFGFVDVADFTHHVENVLAEVREGRLAVTRVLISLILQSRDYITSLIASPDTDRSVGISITEALAELLAASPEQEGLDKSSGPNSERESGGHSPSESTTQSLQEQCSVIAGELFVLVATPDDQTVLAKLRDDFNNLGQGIQQLGWGEFAEFPREVADCIGRAMGQGDVSLPFLDLCDTARNFLEDVFKSGEPPEEKKYQGILKNLEDEAGITGAAEDFQPLPDLLGEILVEQGHVAEEIIDVIVEQQKTEPLGEMLVAAQIVGQGDVDKALEEQQKRKTDNAVSRTLSSQWGGAKSDSIRVAAEKLDTLINLVGELVVTQARLSELGGAHPALELLESIEDVERLTTELRECVLSVRMLPIGSTFSRFKRLVRDLSNDLGKDVQLLTSGAETELDKTMLEMLAEPLVHIIRNAVDHGIETPAEREAKGKAPFGTISMSAIHSGPSVVVVISDDGRGIDCPALYKKGLALGLISPDVKPTDRKVLDLIFQPGMSTSEEVSAVSGRGVGMDVVYSSIAKLKGTVAVTSGPDMGTSMTLTLPLTLSIIDGLLVEAATTRFILPLLQIEECVELSDQGMTCRNGRHLYQFRDQLIPFIRLREFYGFSGDRPELEQMVIVRMKKEFLGVVVDHVIGDHQTVIKSLGWVYRKAPGLSGATILGDGQVALILDIAGMHQQAMTEELLVG